MKHQFSMFWKKSSTSQGASTLYYYFRCESYHIKSHQKLKYLETADQRLPEFSGCPRDNNAQLSVNTVIRSLCYLNIQQMKSPSEYLFPSCTQSNWCQKETKVCSISSSLQLYDTSAPGQCPNTSLWLNKKANIHLHLLTACKSKQLCCESFQDWLIIE